MTRNHAPVAAVMAALLTFASIWQLTVLSAAFAGPATVTIATLA